MTRANERHSGDTKASAADQRPPIPWCDRRRTYCASGCSLRDKLSNSGACDWEARMAAAALLAPRVEAQPRQQEQPSRQQEQQPRQQEQQPRQQQPARHPQQAQHPRSKFGNVQRKGQGGQGPRPRPNDSNSVPPAAPVVESSPGSIPESTASEGVPVAAAATVQPDMFKAPVPASPAIASPEPVVAVVVADSSPVAESPAAGE